MQRKNGQLKKVRGATVMLTVDPEVSAEQILTFAVDKHRACDWTMPRSTYMLLYPDGQLVRTWFRGTVTLLKYKNFIGKAYQKLVLFICDQEDNLPGTYNLCSFQTVIPATSY